MIGLNAEEGSMDRTKTREVIKKRDKNSEYLWMFRSIKTNPESR